MEKYFLSSLENKQLSYVRECEYIRSIKFKTGKNAVIVKLNEPLQWSDSEGFHGSDYAIVTARHEGYDVIEPIYFPTFVYVTVLKEKDYDFVEEIENDDLLIIGIGELYETYEKAKYHVFD
ncbi:hypothetical protein [Treponema sp. C6A8]|uniref:hypothetical protein n=1 Tax=Treponema sp. C6A8 TaxID=1410609 RepID=UPI000484FB44|nr:hypothetical protein [Treponema sp. C6A8]